MTSNISGIPPGSGSLPPVPNRGTSRATALVPVPGVGTPPGDAATAARTLLERSGIELRDLLIDGDVLVERIPASQVALRAQLEAARGALVRNSPADALAILDEVWDSARHTEQGWYLRGGAHAVLGLPGEAARVAQEGLAMRAASPALTFLLSLARLSLGDIVGARQSLAAALEHAPDEPLLLAQQAVLLSRTGDVSGAQRMLQRATALHREHPALLYARSQISNAIAVNARRAVAGTGPVDGGVGGAPPVDDGVFVDELLDHDDPLSAAFRRLSASLADGDAEAVDEASAQLRRALAAGGTLAASTVPERLHAARAIVAMLASVRAGGLPWAHDIDSQPIVEPSPLARTMRVILSAYERHMQTAPETARQLQQLAPSLSGHTRALLQLLLPPDTGAWNAAQGDRHHFAIGTIADDTQRALLGPVRMGLTLLGNEAVPVQVATTRAPTVDVVQLPITREQPVLEPTPPSPGWGIVPPHPAQTRAAHARFAAIVCVVIAIGAMAVGQPIVAIAFAGGASWLALRRVQRLKDTAEYHLDQHR